MPILPSVVAAVRLRDPGPERHAGPVGAGVVAVVHHPHAGERIATSLHGTAATVHPVEIGRRTINTIANIGPDVIVVEVADVAFDLPRLCAALRATTDERIVVFTAGKIDDAAVVAALDAGADDVVESPSPALIDARVRVALRAQRQRPAPTGAIAVGDTVVDVAGHVLTIDQRPVRCPPVQFELLHVLAAAGGATVSTDALLRSVWGVRPGDVHPRRVRIAVSVLRGILGEGPRRPRVETVPHIGYRLVIDASSGASSR